MLVCWRSPDKRHRDAVEREVVGADPDCAAEETSASPCADEKSAFSEERPLFGKEGLKRSRLIC